METLKFWHSFIVEFRALCGEEISTSNLQQAFPINYLNKFFIFSLENENQYVPPLTESFPAAFILFMFEDRIQKAHQAADQAGFDFLIRQPIPFMAMVKSKRYVPYLILLAHGCQIFLGNYFC